MYHLTSTLQRYNKTSLFSKFLNIFLEFCRIGRHVARHRLAKATDYWTCLWFIVYGLWKAEERLGEWWEGRGKREEGRGEREEGRGKSYQLIHYSTNPLLNCSTILLKTDYWKLITENWLLKTENWLLITENWKLFPTFAHNLYY